MIKEINKKCAKEMRNFNENILNGLTRKWHHLSHHLHLNQGCSIKIYPAPFTDALNITSNNNEILEIILYDIASRKIMQQKFTTSVSLNTKQLGKGIYIYEVKNKSGMINKKKVVKD